MNQPGLGDHSTSAGGMTLRDAFVDYLGRAHERTRRVVLLIPP